MVLQFFFLQRIWRS